MRDLKIAGAILIAGLLLLVIPAALLNKAPAHLHLSAKPKIGIPQPSTERYATAIRKAGGRPVILSYEVDQINYYLDQLDGLLLTGGADIDPAEYGEKPHQTVRLTTPERYGFESKLTKAWIERTDKPLLGICLGCQLINVIQGGSLIQDIPSEIDSNHRKDHLIQIEPDSTLLSIFQTEQLPVNSNHHQAVRKLGKNLKVSARSADGIIEAIEMTNKPFVMGVQWHPEKMANDPTQGKLFSRFIEATN